MLDTQPLEKTPVGANICRFSFSGVTEIFTPIPRNYDSTCKCQKERGKEEFWKNITEMEALRSVTVWAVRYTHKISSELAKKNNPVVKFMQIKAKQLSVELCKHFKPALTDFFGQLGEKGASTKHNIDL